MWEMLNLEGDEMAEPCMDKAYSLLLSWLWNEEGDAEDDGEFTVEGGWDWERPTLSLKSLSNDTHFIVLFPDDFWNIRIMFLSHPMNNQQIQRNPF